MSDVIIALDAMGGDHAPAMVLRGADIALERHPGARFLLFGNEDQIAPLLAKLPRLAAAASVHHTDEAVLDDAKPSQALRTGRRSSMRLAIDAVADGRADGVVSAGNTGALMAMAKVSLRTMKGIDRPALAGLMPSLGPNDTVVLDLGANTECDARNLMQFAVMGAAYARTQLDLASPRVALLNIGTEDQKGTEEIRDAAQALRDATHLPLTFTGFIEGDKLSRGDVDVIVCDGFSGNIALKTAEGTARFVADLLRRAFSSSMRSKIGFLISRPATELLRHHLDPNNHNGAVFLGLNGLVVKSHGGANETGVANAIAVAAKSVRDDLARKIAEDLKYFEAHEPEGVVA